MVKFMNKKGLCQLKIDTCHLHLQKLYHGHCNCWLSTALKGVQGKDQEWGAPCSGKNWQKRPSDIRSFQEILWSQFLHLLIPRKTLTSLMVTSALAIKKKFTIKSQNRVLSCYCGYDFILDIVLLNTWVFWVVSGLDATILKTMTAGR